MSLTPLAALKVTSHLIPAHGLTPNTSIQKKPLLIYHGAFQNSDASAIETHLTKVGVVAPHWRYRMYSTSHFHSTTHEVLVIAHGSAKLCFGHEDNSSSIQPVVVKGDVIIVPAGVAHRQVEDREGGFEMVGSYPHGRTWDMCYGRAGEEDKIRSIEQLGWFERDPVYGDEGPVLNV